MSKQLTIHSGSGSSIGQIDLNDDVFGIEPNTCYASCPEKTAE